MKVIVLEADQWTSSGNIEGTKLEDWEADKDLTLANVTGGDSEAAKRMFGGYTVWIREVEEDEDPTIGSVWFRADEAGVLRKWKANPDTSG